MIWMPQINIDDWIGSLKQLFLKYTFKDCCDLNKSYDRVSNNVTGSNVVFITAV